MIQKYNLLTEVANWKVGVGVGGATALAGTIYGGVKAILTRCKGNEEMRQKELDRLERHIKDLKDDIVQITKLLKEYSSKKDKTQEDLGNIEFYISELATLKHSLIVAQTEYAVIKKMPLKDFIKRKAKKEFIENALGGVVGGVLTGGFAYAIKKNHFPVKRKK